MSDEQLKKLFAYIDARIDERAIGQSRDGFEHNYEIRKLNSEFLRRALERAAIDAARKEGQPCQCTNGVIRSMGRDNDEVIEDCPDCSGSKEAKP